MATLLVDPFVEALAEVFETTAFMSLAPLSDDAPAFESALIVTMELCGSCWLHIAVPVSLAAIVAENMLALAPGSDEAKERGTDAMREILNVTAGLYLSRVSLERGIPEMNIPTVRVIEGASEVAVWLAAMGAQVVVADEGPIAAAIEGAL